MAYGKKSGGCTPITAKIQKTTKGGIVQPILNVGKISPAKMKGDLNKDGKMSGYEQTRQNAIDKAMSSPAKNKFPVNPEKIVGIGTDLTPDKTGMAGKTPYSVTGGKGTIHGPKVSYDMAYKNRDMKTYGGMSKAEYIKEAKRQTKSFKGTGSFDVPKPRKKQTSIVAPKAKTVSIETKQPTASVEIKPQAKKATVKVDPKKAAKVANISRRANKSKAKSEAAAAAGNTKKAKRLQKRSERQEARASRQANKAVKPKVNKKELRKAKRKAIKEEKAKFKSAKKEIKSYIDY